MIEAATQLPAWVEDLIDDARALVFDPAGILVAASSRFCEWLDVASEEIVGTPPPWPFWPEDQRERIWGALELMVSGRAAELGIRTHAVAFLRRDGERASAIAEYHPVYDDSGDLSLHLCVITPDRLERRGASSRLGIHRYVSVLEHALREIHATLEEVGVASRRSGLSREAPRLRTLTDREFEVLEHLLAGKQTRDIAEDLHLSAHTIKHHAHAIFRKLGVASRAELLARFVETQPRP